MIKLTFVLSADSDELFLAPEQASRVYDRIGSFQDWQVYEREPILKLVRFGSFHSAEAIFEFGCGTGAFAATLLRTQLPPDSRYVGIDVSPKMVQLATSRLAPWSERAEVRLSDGSSRLPEPDNRFDRFVSNYVFDLLAPKYATTVIGEAYRVLGSGGKLCLTSLGRGKSGLSRTLTKLWEGVWQCKPEWVGGCRPVDLRQFVTTENWTIERHESVISFGIPSEVLVASRHSD